MGKTLFDWKRFRDIATPEEAARILTDWYGQEAARHAAGCGLAARSDDRDEDYRFWCAVFAELDPNADGPDRPGAAS